MSEEQGAAGRTAADVSALLVELGRALKGWSFYPPEHPARKELLERAWRACHGELRRGGPLELEIRRGAFWLPGAEAPIAQGRSDDTARQLFVRSVRRIVFDPALDAETLAAFLEALATDPDDLARAGGFEAVFYDGARQGIQVNEADWRALLEARRVDAAAEAQRAGDPHEVSLEEAPGLLAGAAGDGLSLESLLGTLGAAAAAAGSAPEETQADAADAAPEEAASAAGAPRAELDGVLRRLERSGDDLEYRDLARRAVALAHAMAERDDLEGACRALAVLAHHAGDDARRSYAQRETAIQFLDQLADERVLGEVLARATSSDGERVLAATATLRELGRRAAPMLLDQLEGELDPERRGRLAGVLIAMGDEAVPALGDAIATGGERRMRVALRLAGETQNPQLVPALAEALLSGPPEVAREAAQALVRIGDVTALEALTQALAAGGARAAGLAAFSLGTTGRVLALSPLVGALERALAAGELGLAREIVRGLGRLGRPEAVPALADLLGRGGWLSARRLREVKLAAVSALAHLPGPDAEQLLVRAARSRDGRLREAAQAALQRRLREQAGAQRGAGAA